MSVFRFFPIALRKAYCALFRQHLSVRVAKKGVRVVLQDRPTLPSKLAPLSRAELNARKEQQAYTLMRQQLADLLDELPETRATMRHLVFVEKALERKGLRAFGKLPLDVLQRALEQLEGLVVNWSPEGLATLRSRMAVTIIDRDNQSPLAEAESYNTAAVMDTTPVDEFKAGLDVRTDDDALAAAYAALGDLAPAGVELQPELGPSGAASGQPLRALDKDVTLVRGEIRIHALNS